MSPIHERHICWPLWTSIPACILETYQTNVISVKECDSLGFALNAFKKKSQIQETMVTTEHLQVCVICSCFGCFSLVFLK